MVCVYKLVVYYSSNASFRTSSDTAVSILSLLYVWQADAGAIFIWDGTVVITACRFVGNTVTVSDLVCMHNLFCTILQMLHFKLTLLATAASIGLLSCFWQAGAGAIFNFGGSMVITGSEFEGNTATDGTNNIYSDDESDADITCDDGTNKFESPAGGVTESTDSEGNYPAGTCAS
jgi:hypothetical protein